MPSNKLSSDAYLQSMAATNQIDLSKADIEAVKAHLVTASNLMALMQSHSSDDHTLELAAVFRLDANND